jgi:sulfite reductase alpha subunit-like flavoprotein
MATLFATESTSDGPMLPIGADMGIAPFRGFAQRRLKSANCANKMWALQEVLEELHSGE